MKFLHKIISSVKPHFEKEGKLSRFWVVFDSLETFTFTPGHVTKQGSHIRDGIDLKRTMFLVIMALVPALLFGTWNIGDQYFASIGTTDADMLAKLTVGAVRVIPLILVTYGVGLGIEFVFAGLRGHGINEGFLVSGMLIPLIMPVDVPLWMVAAAVAFAVIIGKEVFGGTGMNIVNVALTARAFLFFAYPKQMSGEIWIQDIASSKAGGLLVDGHTGATALGHLASTVGEKVGEMKPVMDALFGGDCRYETSNGLVRRRRYVLAS
jgi:Na+-transporting NADH:ubiquinone oxidoreductase subunit B